MPSLSNFCGQLISNLVQPKNPVWMQRSRHSAGESLACLKSTLNLPPSMFGQPFRNIFIGQMRDPTQRRSHEIAKERVLHFHAISDPKLVALSTLIRSDLPPTISITVRFICFSSTDSRR